MQGIPDITPFKSRLLEINHLMQQENFYNNQREAAKIGREHQKLTELVTIYQKLEQLDRDIQENKKLIKKNFFFYTTYI